MRARAGNAGALPAVRPALDFREPRSEFPRVRENESQSSAIEHDRDRVEAAALESLMRLSPGETPLICASSAAIDADRTMRACAHARSCICRALIFRGTRRILRRMLRA